MCIVLGAVMHLLGRRFPKTLALITGFHTAHFINSKYLLKYPSRVPVDVQTALSLVPSLDGSHLGHRLNRKGLLSALAIRPALACRLHLGGCGVQSGLECCIWMPRFSVGRNLPGTPGESSTTH